MIAIKILQQICVTCSISREKPTNLKIAIMETKITYGNGDVDHTPKSLAEELFSKKESLKKKVKEKNLQLKNLLKTNLELLKNNDINTMLLF